MGEKGEKGIVDFDSVRMNIVEEELDLSLVKIVYEGLSDFEVRALTFKQGC